jgi:glycosyltransferase involved in cell wall biosynthesis
MNILVLPSWYPTATNPLNGVFFREQALALQKAGHRVSVLVSPILLSKQKLGQVRRWSELRAQVLSQEDHGLPTYRVYQWGWFPGFLQRGNLWLQVRAAQRAFDRYRQDQGLPDVIHAHSILYGGYVAGQIGARWHVPVVITEHSTRFQRSLIRPDQVPIIRDTLRLASKRLAVSPTLAAELRPYDKGCEIEVLGNLVDGKFFALPQDPLPAEPFVFTAVAFLEPKKGFDILLEAFALAFRGKPARLHIGGDGSQRSALEKQASDLGIAPQVEFLGRLPRNEVRALLQQSHVLVSSSHVETFGVTLIEAMACGKPVVATRSGGPDSIVDETSGLLVEPGNASALATAMRHMRDDYGRYDPEKIRASCLARFGQEAIVQRLTEIYRTLAPTITDLRFGSR